MRTEASARDDEPERQKQRRSLTLSEQLFMAYPWTSFQTWERTSHRLKPLWLGFHFSIWYAEVCGGIEPFPCEKVKDRDRPWEELEPETRTHKSGPFMSCLCFPPNAWVILSHSKPTPSLYKKHGCHSSGASCPAATTKGQKLLLQPRASRGSSTLPDDSAFCWPRCPPHLRLRVRTPLQFLVFLSSLTCQMTLPPRWLRKEDAGIREFPKAPSASFPHSPALERWVTFGGQTTQATAWGPLLRLPQDHSNSSSLFPQSSLVPPQSKLTATSLTENKHKESSLGPTSFSSIYPCFCSLPSKASKELLIRGRFSKFPFALKSRLCSPSSTRLCTLSSCSSAPHTSHLMSYSRPVWPPQRNRTALPALRTVWMCFCRSCSTGHLS